MEQLLQVVLQRRPSQQQLVVDLIPVKNPKKLDRMQNVKNMIKRMWPNKHFHILSEYRGGIFIPLASAPFCIQPFNVFDSLEAVVPLIGCSSVCGPRPPPDRPR